MSWMAPRTPSPGDEPATVGATSADPQLILHKEWPGRSWVLTRVRRIWRPGNPLPSRRRLRPPSRRRRPQMPTGDVETFHQDGKWRNKVEGEDGAESAHDTKEEAISAGRDMARSRKVEHIIR